MDGGDCVQVVCVVQSCGGDCVQVPGSTRYLGSVCSGAELGRLCGGDSADCTVCCAELGDRICNSAGLPIYKG